MKTMLYLVPLLVVTVSLLIRAELLEKRRQVYVLKPISTLIVIAMALLSLLEPVQNATYAVCVLVGLVFSLGGDVALMFHESRRAFTVGLALFLLAHVAYTTAFVMLGRFSAWDLLSTVVLLALAVGFYRLIRPNLGRMRAPVIAYMVVISVMVSRALSTLVSPVFGAGQAIMVAVGAILFYVSDIILAANRFWRPLKYHRFSLTLYYGGQMLIALAASYFR